MGVDLSPGGNIICYQSKFILIQDSGSISIVSVGRENLMKIVVHRNGSFSQILFPFRIDQFVHNAFADEEFEP